MKRWDLCNNRLSRFNPSRFLEIGVRGGRTGREIRADWKIGVDPLPRMGAIPHYTALYRQTSDEFFAVQTAFLNLSVVLVDGLHHAEQAERDIANSLNHLTQTGTIVVHDCNPPDEASQIVPQQQSHWNGDVWKAIVTLRATRSDLHVYTLDTDEGLGVIERCSNLVGGPAIAPPGKLTWEGLILHRKEWLGLVSC